MLSGTITDVSQYNAKYNNIKARLLTVFDLAYFTDIIVGIRTVNY